MRRTYFSALPRIIQQTKKNRKSGGGGSRIEYHKRVPARVASRAPKYSMIPNSGFREADGYADQRLEFKI